MNDDREELRLLRTLWDFAWNEMTTTDPEYPNPYDWQCLSIADDMRLTEICTAIEDHYVEHGFPEASA